MMKNFTISLFLVTISAFALGQSETKQKASVQENTQQVGRVSKEQFKQMIKSYPDAQIVDVRTEEEFNRGSISNAINIDYMGKDFESKIQELKKNTTTLIYCHGGGRSAKALQLFKKAGFTRAAELEGGYSNWD